MAYVLLAAEIAFIHGLFVLFVIFGSVLVVCWPRAIWLHLPALAWGVIVELSGAMCPLTPLEFHFRALAGQSGYNEDFLSRWLFTVLYPGQLTRGIQIALGASLLALNLFLYLWIWRTSRR